MSRTIVLTGYAVVAFKKIIKDVEEDEIEEMLGDVDRQELQIDEDDLRDIESINNIYIEVRP
ncbi:hypothetical protein [Pseudomonas koreensis]|uniref:hypothetical protein n=1 Tax=Pseudomonas koreensis TaxID=198620 RepID=UPI0018E6A5B4|nr:hypothetical protein [Pseudomonas koreensis]MBI6948572.1 hypothetical protein [Pseudomonas koreensis]